MRKYHVNTEINYCSNCNQGFSYPEVYKTWKCPRCGHPLVLKVMISGRAYSCTIHSPVELQSNAQVTLDNNVIYHLISIEEENGGFLLAFRGYTKIRCAADDQVAVVNGSWYD